MRYIRYKIEKQQINFLNCNKIDEWIDTCHTRDTDFIDVCASNCECGSTVGLSSSSGDTSGNKIRTTVRGNGIESVVLRYSGNSENFDKLLIDGVSFDTITTECVFNDDKIHTVDYFGVKDTRHFFMSSYVITAAFPSSITAITGTLLNCFSLTSVKIPNSVKKIGADAFNNCIKLTSIEIPDSVTEIGSGAFFSCSGLTSITIGSGVKSIGDYCIYFCTSLKSITCYAKTAPFLGYNNAIYGLPPNGTLHVPQGSDYSSWLKKMPSSWKIEYI